MARRKRTYLLRVAYLGLMLAVLSLAYSSFQPYAGRTESLVQQAQRRAELGHMFLAVFAVFSVLAMMLVGPVLTSGAIGSERLKRTLDVLLMTPLPAWKIATGKLLSRSVTAFTLIGLTLPVLAVVRLLGGVPWEDMFGAIALAAAVAIGSASLGLLLSGMLKRAFAVILLSYLLQAAVYAILPIVFSIMFFSQSRGGSPASQQTYFTLVGAINPAFTAALRSARSGALGVDWWPAIAVQLGVAAAMTLATTMVLRRESRGARPERRNDTPADASTATSHKFLETALSPGEPPVTPGQRPESLEALGAAPHYERIDRSAPTRSPVFDNPVLWREVRQPLLAKRWQRVVAIVATLGMLGLSYLSLAMDHSLDRWDTQIPYAFGLTTLLLLIGIVLSATAIATEKESDTWTTLLMSPLSGHAIVWGKFRGILRRLRWPYLLMAGHFTLFMLCGTMTFVAWAVVLFTAAIYGLPWVATGIYLSLRCTRVTTAVVLNLLVPLFFYAAVPMGLAAYSSRIDPNVYHNWGELVCYYLPYYYQDMAIERMRVHNNFGHASLPLSGTEVPVETILWLCIAAGVVLAGTAALVMTVIGARFDKIVGRAAS